MFCPKCGANAGNSNFCPKCGYNLGDVPVDLMHSNQLNQQPRPPRPTPVPPKKKKHHIGRIVAAIILVPIAVTLAICLPNAKFSYSPSAAASTQPVDKKAAALKTDKILCTATLETSKCAQDLTTIIKGLASGTTDEYTAYKNAQTIESNMGTISAPATDVNANGVSDYSTAVSSYTTSIFGAAHDLVKYLDNNKLSTLSSIDYSLQQATADLTKAIAARDTFLSSAGVNKTEKISNYNESNKDALAAFK